MAENKDELIELAVEKYDMQDNWINKIASKYLEVNNINHLKVGLFGYINEVMATSLRYGMAHRNFLYDEAFLNTASLTKSIYNTAKSYNYDIGFATPSQLEVTFSIRQSDIFTYGVKEVDPYTGRYNGNYTFTITPDDLFYLGNYQFIIESPIIIKANLQKDNSYSYTSMYDRSNSSHNKGMFSGSTKPYVTTWVDRNSNYEDIVTLQFTIYQVYKQETLFENFSSDLSENLFFDIDYRNHLCYFDVLYKTQTKSEYLSKYFNETFTPEEEYYCYYYFDSNKLTVYFSGLVDNFKPAINSKLYVYTYTTLGIKGNFNYEGDVYFRFKKDFFNTNVQIVVNKLTDPVGGVDTPSKLQLKKDLIYEFLTRDNLITETDLNNFFNNIINKQIVNQSEILFIKKRDDMFKRSFAGFLLLKDKSGLIVPSNTVDLDIHPLNLNKEFHIQCGSIVIYDEETHKYVLANPNDMTYFEITDEENEIIKYKEFPTESDYDEYKLAYRLPYALHYKKSPFPRLLAIQNNFNKNLYFDYEYINSNISAEFIINKMNITRASVTYDRLLSDDINTDEEGNITNRKIVITNGNTESTFMIVYKPNGNIDLDASNNMEPYVKYTNDINKYFISFNLNTTLSQDYFNKNPEYLQDGVICRCVVSSENDTPFCYFDFKLDNYQTMNYSYELLTDNTISDNNELLILSTDEFPVYDIHTNLRRDRTFFCEKTKFQIYILTKIIDFNNEPMRVMKYPLKNMYDLANYTMAVTFKGNRDFSLFNILNSIIDPEPDFVKDEVSNTIEMSTRLRQLPVIGKHYLYNYSVFKDFFQTMSLYYEILMDNFDKLESNTSLNIKFYNTYGESKYFNTPITNISLHLVIKLIDSFTQNLDYEIKNFIVEFVENVNKTSNKTFAISNLVRELEHKFDDIQYIEFISLSNDSGNQVVTYNCPSIKEMTQQQLIDYIPEYLNVHIGKNAYIEGKDNFQTGISIEYK